MSTVAPEKSRILHLLSALLSVGVIDQQEKIASNTNFQMPPMFLQCLVQYGFHLQGISNHKPSQIAAILSVCILRIDFFNRSLLFLSYKQPEDVPGKVFNLVAVIS